MREENGSPRSGCQFTLKGLLGCLLVLSLAIAIVVHALMAAQKQSNKSNCKGSLKQLANYLTLYVSRYGSEQDYPTTVALYGSGAPIPAGPNGAFWSWLYRVPNRTNAVSRRPGDDSAYECPAYGGYGHARVTTLEYTGP